MTEHSKAKAGNAPQKGSTAALLQRVRSDICAMQAYPVQDATGMVKLDAMENPYSLPLPLQQALGQRLCTVALNRYPVAAPQALRQAILKHLALPAKCGLVLGNGSDELIDLLARVFDQHAHSDQPKACILAAEPSFIMYRQSAQLQGLDFVGVSLTPNFELDLPAMLAAIAKYKPALTYLAYPNNPSANLYDSQAIEQVIDACKQINGWVVLDEAYQPFANGASFLPRLGHWDNLMLLRTLSKFGLAGVRIGFLLGPHAIMQHIEKVRPPYNVSTLNAECALFALEHSAAFEQQAQAICQERDALITALNAMPQLQAFPSAANMVLVRTPAANTLFTYLLDKGILVKNVSNAHPLLAQCLRLSVGSAQENQSMIQALAQALASVTGSD